MVRSPHYTFEKLPYALRSQIRAKVRSNNGGMDGQEVPFVDLLREELGINGTAEDNVGVANRFWKEISEGDLLSLSAIACSAAMVNQW